MVDLYLRSVCFSVSLLSLPLFPNPNCLKKASGEGGGELDLFLSSLSASVQPLIAPVPPPATAPAAVPAPGTTEPVAPPVKAPTTAPFPAPHNFLKKPTIARTNLLFPTAPWTLSSHLKKNSLLWQK